MIDTNSIADYMSDIVFDELNDDDVDNEIDNFYLSSEYVDVFIASNNSKCRFFNIIGKDDSESAHSNFLLWFFENKDFSMGPVSPLNRFVMLLLRLTSGKNNNQILCKPDNDVETLRSAIRNNLISEIRLTDSEKRREVTFELGRKDPDGKAKRSVDLLLNATFELNGQKKTIRIVIENKVKTYEHDKQCKAYELYYSSKNSLADYTFFVYLAPYRVNIGELSSDAFISVDYQMIYDIILKPIIDNSTEYNENSIRILKQYINSIINTDGIMVVSAEYKEKLRNFFNANRNLILTAMKYSGDEHVQKLANQQRKKDATNNVSFEYQYNGKTYVFNTLADLVYKTVKDLAESGKYSAQQLISKFDNIGKIFASKSLISTVEPVNKDGAPNQRHLTSGKRDDIMCGGVKLYVSNQLAYNGNDNMNGKKFIKFVNEDTSLGIKITVKD